MRYLIGAPKTDLEPLTKEVEDFKNLIQQEMGIENIKVEIVPIRIKRAWHRFIEKELHPSGEDTHQIGISVNEPMIHIKQQIIHELSHVKPTGINWEEIEQLHKKYGLPSVFAEKEPWQMTKKEFMANPPEELDIWLMENKPPHRGKIGAISDFLGGPPTKGYRVANTLTPFDIAHKNIVKHALKEGKSIPREVLVDYPELAPKAEIRMVKEAPNTFRFYEGEKELGFATRVRDMEKGKDFYIGRLMSYEEGKGYGTRMTQALIDYAKKQGHETLTLVASRPASIRIGEKLGFKQIGKWGTDPILRLSIAPKASESKYLI